MALTIANITELFLAQGAVQYGSEAVSQQQHITTPDWAYYVAVLESSLLSAA